MDFRDYANLELSWARVGGDPERQYRTVAGSAALELSVGDFPTDAAYTLLVDGISAGEFDSWPERWSRRDVDPNDGEAPSATGDSTSPTSKSLALIDNHRGRLPRTEPDSQRR